MASRQAQYLTQPANSGPLGNARHAPAKSFSGMPGAFSKKMMTLGKNNVTQ
jgi:hypothetical protein